MNILFLDSIERTTYGGVEHWIGLIANGLAARGHQIHVVGRDHSEFLRRTRQNAPEATVTALNIRGDFDPVTILMLVKLLKRHRIDTIVVVFNKDVRLGGLAARMAGRVRVIWRLGIDLTRRAWMHRFLTPKLINGVITPSHSLKEEILTCGYLDPSNITVIPTGLPDARPESVSVRAREELAKQFSIPVSATLAVTSGRFVNQKGHKYLVAAAPRMVSRHPDLHFLLLGDGPLENELRRSINENALRPRFLFAGMLDNPADVLPMCDLMIHPSVVEPFGIAILEGMRAGLPVVASRVGGIPEVVSEGENALLVPPHDPDMLADAVNALLDDRRKLAAMGAASRNRWRQHFSDTSMLDRVEKALTPPSRESR